jgi:putative heme-binding domain-containing protein
VVAARSEQNVFSNIELEKILLATPVSELAQVAMKRGNLKPGKNLFYKSSAACATCHHPSKNGVRLGPDLQELKTSLSPEQLVESLLYPSKRIDKNYAQVTVITNDGKQHTGMRVSEDDNQLLLRNLAQPAPVYFQKDDIDEIFESPISLMPENLVRQLKNRQEFDDLMRYVLEVRKR